MGRSQTHESLNTFATLSLLNGKNSYRALMEGSDHSLSQARAIQPPVTAYQLIINVLDDLPMEWPIRVISQSPYI